MKKYPTLVSTQFHDRSDFQIRKRTGDPRDWQIQCVCGKRCNNGWMRTLDEKAAPLLTPILTGQSVRISPAQQATIAAWAVMKAIVAEYDDPDYATTHHMQRRRVMNKQLPPEQGWGVWLGHFPHKLWTPTRSFFPFQLSSGAHIRARIEKHGNDLATYFNGHVFTHIFGEIFIQSIHAPHPRLVRNWRFPRLPDGGQLVRIWPTTDYSINWPPHRMTRRDVDIATITFRQFLVDHQQRTLAKRR